MDKSDLVRRIKDRFCGRKGLWIFCDLKAVIVRKGSQKDLDFLLEKHGFIAVVLTKEHSSTGLESALIEF